MNKLFILVHIILWSCLYTSLAKADNSILSLGPFFVDTKILATSPQKKVVVKNLPHFFSSGIFNLCSPNSATYLLQKFACDNDEPLKGKICENLDDQEKISPISLMSYYMPDPEINDRASVISFNNIPLNQTENEFKSGTGPSALMNAKLNGFSLFPNSCMPFDQFVNQATLLYQSDENPEINFFKKLKNLYDNLKEKKKNISEGKICIDCLTENDPDYTNMVSLFSSKKDELFFKKFKQAISKDTFEKFLFSIFFTKCNRLDRLSPSPKIKTFPEVDSTDVTVSKIKQKILQNLDESRIMILADLCVKKMNKELLQQCNSKHDLVITGYTEYLQKGSIKTYVQIKQSLGDKFEKIFGEVDIDELLENVPNPGKKGTLIWLEKESN